MVCCNIVILWKIDVYVTVTIKKKRIFISFHFHLFCKKQLTERNCTIKLENWLKYNSSNMQFMQLQIKLQVQIGLTVNVNDLLRMLTGKKAIVYRLG